VGYFGLEDDAGRQLLYRMLIVNQGDYFRDGCIPYVGSELRVFDAAEGKDRQEYHP